MASALTLKHKENIGCGSRYGDWLAGFQAQAVQFKIIHRRWKDILSLYPAGHTFDHCRYNGLEPYMLHQLAYINVFIGKSTPQYIVRIGHDLHILPFQVGMQDAGILEDSLPGCHELTTLNR